MSVKMRKRLQTGKEICIVMNGDHQEKLFHAMERADFYPHPVERIELRETHISKVFLTGPFVYKIKKPVKPGFLDFTSLSKRQDDCRREVDLNRRLTRDVYLDVVSLNFRGGAYSLSGPGEVVEYAVKMRQLDDEAVMGRLLSKRKIDQEAIGVLAGVLGRFYSRMPTGGEIDRYGSRETVRCLCDENFTQLEPFAGSFVDVRIYGIVRSATRSFLRRRKGLFQKRIENGKIRDCHGDLRTEHIYFEKDGIQIIDCIEFNDHLRYGDITLDLAFLAMDLDFAGFPHAAGSLLTSYVQFTKDDGVFLLVEFYKCYRALVRAKVNCLKLKEAGLSAREKQKLMEATHQYMALAYRYALQFTRPTLWVVCGMIASGKSTVSGRLAKKLDLRVLSTDIIRKKLFDVPPETRIDASFETSVYSPHATSLTYGKLLRKAQQELRKGSSVILDGTFGRRRRRSEALRLAEDMDANIVFVETTASRSALKDRLKNRESENSISDARLAHFHEFEASFEPLEDIPEDLRIRIDTEKPVTQNMQQILSSDYYLLSKKLMANGDAAT